jgi:hypothetical protein
MLFYCLSKHVMSALCPATLSLHQTACWRNYKTTTSLFPAYLKNTNSTRDNASRKANSSLASQEISRCYEILRSITSPHPISVRFVLILLSHLRLNLLTNLNFICISYFLHAHPTHTHSPWFDRRNIGSIWWILQIMNHDDWKQCQEI